MEIKEFKDVVEINNLATAWIKDYKENKLGDKSAKLKKQYKEMCILKAQTDKVKERHGGDYEASDWKSLYEDMKKLAKASPSFAICFGGADDLLGTKSNINESEAVTAIKLKKMASAWYGQFGEEVKDKNVLDFVMRVYDKAQKVMVAPKEIEGEVVTIAFYGSDSKRCRKMERKMKFIADEYAGVANVEINQIKDEDDSMAKLAIKNLPAIKFKRGKKAIATHEGELSISALESKINTLIEGANFTDSSSVPSVNDMKSINKKELYSLGEFLLFYFDASWCGVCKKTTPVIEKYARNYSNVKFEIVTVDGSHSHHKTFGVTHVPSLVFVRDGAVIGKHVGYINPSDLDKKMEEFSVSKKRKIGLSKDENCSLIPTEAGVVAAAKDKTKEKKA